MRSPTLATFLFGFVFVGCGGGGQAAPVVVVVPEVASAAPVTEQPAPVATQPPEKPRDFEWSPLDDARDDRGHQRFFVVASAASERAQSLETRLSSMASTDAARLQVLHDLAEAYTVVAMHARGAAQSDAAERASKAAVQKYLLISREYPGHLDVLYYAGLESERAGDLDNARRLYLELIMKQPRGPFVAHAYFAFGEMFLQSAHTDPSKAPLAKQAFSEALKYLRPGDRLHPFAQSRLDEANALAGTP